MSFDNIPKHHGIHVLLQQLIANAEVFALHIRETALFQIAGHGITEHPAVLKEYGGCGICLTIH